jgi:hypothetical protein
VVKVFHTALALTLLGASWGAWAEINDSHTGNGLITACKTAVAGMDTDRDSGWIGGFCTGLISGVADSWDEFTFCLPTHSTRGQYVRVVYKYLQEHPAELQERDSVLVLKALKAAWPCPKKP